ncbi:serine hydrolase [Mycobacterium lepromatosis]|uniref:serine hydrolase n=1 Tax=Mycobacterium lepromatosis TaxID=480418 RepID=UPI000695E508|nr:serine hydrolase [Mycobacterium lepromatosis]
MVNLVVEISDLVRGRVLWTTDTAPMVFSATKGLVATVISSARQLGLIEYSAPVGGILAGVRSQRQVNVDRS